MEEGVAMEMGRVLRSTICAGESAGAFADLLCPQIHTLTLVQAVGGSAGIVRRASRLRWGRNQVGQGRQSLHLWGQ